MHRHNSPGVTSVRLQLPGAYAAARGSPGRLPVQARSTQQEAEVSSMLSTVRMAKRD